MKNTKNNIGKRHNFIRPLNYVKISPKAYISKLVTFPFFIRRGRAKKYTKLSNLHTKYYKLFYNEMSIYEGFCNITINPARYMPICEQIIKNMTNDDQIVSLVRNELESKFTNVNLNILNGNQKEIVIDSHVDYGDYTTNYKILTVAIGRFDEAGNLVTNLARFQNTIHELAHLIDYKYHGRAYETSEICSYFFEKIFINEIQNNLGMYSKLLSITKEDLQKDIGTLYKTKVEKVLIPSAGLFYKDFSYERLHHTNRYIVGNILSELLFERYQIDKEDAIHAFKAYIQEDNGSTLNQDINLLSNGKYKNFSQAFEHYLQRFETDIAKANKIYLEEHTSL